MLTNGAFACIFLFISKILIAAADLALGNGFTTTNNLTVVFMTYDNTTIPTISLARMISLASVAVLNLASFPRNHKLVVIRTWFLTCPKNADTSDTFGHPPSATRIFLAKRLQQRFMFRVLEVKGADRLCRI